MDELNLKMTAIAKEIRTLSDTTDKLNLDAMAKNVREGNAEIATQAELLEQALSALEGKIIADRYEEGFAAGKHDGEISVPSLAGFNGIATENDGEYYYAGVDRDSVWVNSLIIPFDGEEGAEYLLMAKVKCETTKAFGIAFKYEDGTYALSERTSDTEYFNVAAISTATKRVTGIGYTYGSNGSGYIRDFVVKKLTK